MNPFLIPYVDLAKENAGIKEELLEAVGNVIDQGQFILGDQVAEFERRFAKLCGVGYAVGVNSGTDALILALRSLGIGPGDEVITVPNSFIATVSAIQMTGARPVLVDVRDDYNMNPENLSAAVTSRTRAILPVHFTGRSCEMDPILEIAREREILVIEDAAQAVLAEYKGQRVGSFGTVGCFSLHPLKTLNACGDGGVLTTDSRELYERLQTMRNLGLRGREDCISWSPHSRLDTLQAAILLVKLRYVEQWTRRRQENADHYRRRLGTLSQLRLPAQGEPYKSVYHTFIIHSERRDELQDFLAERGIESVVHYPLSTHLTQAGKELGYPEGSFPKAESQARCILSLPVYPALSSQQVDQVCDVIEAFYLNPDYA